MKEVKLPSIKTKEDEILELLSGMVQALGMTLGGGRAQDADRLAQFTEGKTLKPFISEEIGARTKNPLKFKLPTGTIAHGYEANLLPDICNAVLEAREAGVLKPQQKHIAKQCEIVVRGLAVIGIIALVDEATGYQEVRDRQAFNPPPPLPFPSYYPYYCR